MNIPAVYSYLKASTGCKRVARNAGYKPPKRASDTATAKARKKICHSH
jgi:hypothetical protein